mgnify:CR=1 FL=1
MGLVCILIRCNLTIKFSSNEIFIPRYEITNDINALQHIRLIQLLNWPIIKKRMHETYPMIQSVSLSWQHFPTIDVLIKEKSPWVMIINKNDPKIFSEDGTLLNKNLSDVELPNNNILIVSAATDLIQNDQIKSDSLSVLQNIAKLLEQVPLLNLQQIIFKDGSIQIIEESGLIINVGNQKHLKEKFLMLKYFIGENRKKMHEMQLIDIQFPKRVIIK